MWRKPHCIPIAVRQDSQWRSVEHKANSVFRRKINMFSGTVKLRPGCLFMERAICKQGNAASDQSSFLMHSRCSSDLSEESGNREDFFACCLFFEHSELTEDKQFSRSVGSSRRTRRCIGVTKGLSHAMWDIYPGQPGLVQWQHVCAGWCLMDMMKPKNKLQSKDFLEGLLWVWVSGSRLLQCTVSYPPSKFWLVMGALCCTTSQLDFFLAQGVFVSNFPNKNRKSKCLPSRWKMQWNENFRRVLS